MIALYEPYLESEEEQLVLECIQSSWVSSLGKYIGMFEDEFAAKCRSRYAVTTSSGTTALHLILCALGIGPGHEVLVPTLTFVATANAVRYTGAVPVFVDSELDTWNISVEDAERCVTARTKAVIAVHLYGHPCKMMDILAFAERHHLLVIEDACEAHFAKIGDTSVGTFGIASAFSFYGNKIMTTGEGGMVATSDEVLANRLRHLRDHAMSPTRRYWHDEVGFNYRMTNLQAALGVAQLRKIERILKRKSEIADCYRANLSRTAGITLPPSLPGYTNVHWLFSMLVGDEFGMDRDELISLLAKEGVDTRPFFIPLHTMPPYSGSKDKFPVATDLSQRGISLPSSPKLSLETVEAIAKLIKEAQRNA